MNSLSLYIYLASVVPNIGPLMVFLGILALITLLIRCIYVAIQNEDPTEDKRTFPSTSWFLIPAFCWLIASLVPSERALYMIAASKMGETVITNPEMQEVFSSLKIKIMDELKVENKDDD